MPARIALALALLLGLLTLPWTGTASAVTADADWVGPLSARGRYVVDANGDRFRLRSANWGGAQGSWNGSGDPDDPLTHHVGERSDQVPIGLDRVPLATLLADFRRIGVNSIRLPFSNAMIHDTAPVPDRALAANPQLRGRTPLQVFDAVVAALTADGFAVILNNHTNTARWCCGLDGNERWNTSQSTARWVDDWAFMAARYRHDQRVVGADLYNEVRRTVLDDPNWGSGDDHDWYAAAQTAADRILSQANSDLLIVIEGINWTGIPADGLPHGRPTLTPVRTLSHTLLRSGKLVYSAHFYGFTGPNHAGAYGMGETHDPRYQDLTRDELARVVRDQALFVTEEGHHHTAPVWISEFGVGIAETGAAARAWFANFTDQLAATDADFAYWPLVGWTGGDEFALLRYDRDGRRTDVLDPTDWRATDWRKLVDGPSRTGQIPAGARYNMLAPDHGDAIRSLRAAGWGDWDSGARKSVCPDGQRLAGLAHTGAHGLCADGAVGDGYTVVRDERHVHSGDWAGGYTKFECPSGQLLTGYSVRGAAVSAALCSPAGRPLGTTGRTVWFDRGDNRPAGNPGGEFAHGRYKGQCSPTEYAAGIAFTKRFASSGTPDALLCRTL